MRLRVPDSGETIVEDVIRGRTAFPNVNMDDPVIARADGSALYNFAVAIDDLDAGITHVVRGEDHLSNTPKQLLVLEALGATPPLYAHLPLLHGPDGRKLSKRHGAASVQELRDAGYLPEAVDNYIALLGAGFAADEEHFTLPELAERFRLERVSKNPAVFDERKLRHINGRHLRELGTDELTRRLEEFTGRVGPARRRSRSRPRRSRPWPTSGRWCRSCSTARSTTRRRLPRRSASDGGAEALARPAPRWPPPSPSTAETIEAALRGVVEASGRKPGKVFQPVRVAIAGQTVSPGIFETVALLGTRGKPGADRPRPEPRSGRRRRSAGGRLNRSRKSADRRANGRGNRHQPRCTPWIAGREG